MTRDEFKSVVQEAMNEHDAKCQLIVVTEIQKHEKESIAHNPYKGGVLLGAVIGAWEGIRRMFFHS